MKRGAAIASRGALAPHSPCVPPPRTPSPPHAGKPRSLCPESRCPPPWNTFGRTRSGHETWDRRAPPSPAPTLRPSDRCVEMRFDAADRERANATDLTLRLHRDLAHPSSRWFRTRRSPSAPSQLPRASTPGGDATSPTDRRWVALRRPGPGPCTSVCITHEIGHCDRDS
jgi:hypothetical protein